MGAYVGAQASGEPLRGAIYGALTGLVAGTAAGRAAFKAAIKSPDAALGLISTRLANMAPELRLRQIKERQAGDRRGKADRSDFAKRLFEIERIAADEIDFWKALAKVPVKALVVFDADDSFRRDACVNQRSFERKTAANQKTDEIVLPQRTDVADLLDKFARPVHPVARQISAQAIAQKLTVSRPTL